MANGAEDSYYDVWSAYGKGMHVHVEWQMAIPSIYVEKDTIWASTGEFDVGVNFYC